MDGMTLWARLRAAWRLAQRFGWPLPRLAGADGEDEGGGDAGDGNGAGAGDGGGDATSAALDRLASSFETFQNESKARFDSFEQRLPQAAAEEDDDDEGPNYEFEFDDDDYDDDGGLTQEAQMRALQQMMQQVAQEQMRPHLEAQADARRAEQANALEEQYPELQDEELQDRMVAETIRFAQALNAPALAREPALLEIVYLADRARRNGEDEIPAGSERDVQLERTGAAGAGGGEEEDIEAKIAAAYSRGHHRIGR